MMFAIVCLASLALASAGDPPKAEPKAEVPNVVVNSGNSAMDWTYVEPAEPADPAAPLPPSRWAEKYPNCAKEGVQQSPIDVPAIDDSAIVALDERKTRFYNETYTMVVSNNGRNLKITFICCNSPFIYGGALPDKEKYFFYYANIFVGKDSTSGSQHTFQGKSYPMELTLHSFKLTAPEDPAEKKTSAAVSLFFEETAEDNKALAPFVDAVSRAYKFDQVTQFKTNNLLSMFIPNKVQATYPNDYFTYQGTLSSPPCDDKVTWFLIRTPLQIGKAQLEVLRKAQDEKENQLAGNRRPIQAPVEGLEVIRSDPKNYKKW